MKDNDSLILETTERLLEAILSTGYEKAVIFCATEKDGVLATLESDSGLKFAERLGILEVIKANIIAEANQCECDALDT